MILELNDGALEISIGSIDAIKSRDTDLGRQYMFFVNGQIITHSSIQKSEIEYIENTLDSQWRGI